MNEKSGKTTRREFLKKGASLAGAVIFSGLGPACTFVTQNNRNAGRDQNSAPSGGRHDYQIFSQGSIGRMLIKNRLVRSATMICAASGGRPTKEYIEMYKKLAEGGVGMIITGFMVPTKADAKYSRQMDIYDDSYISGLRDVAEAVHGADPQCRIVAQIGHSGESVSPSGIKWPFFWKKRGKALTTQEVDSIVNDFADAIWRVKASGFDGVELHGAHAYLISSFLSPYTNKRTDKYGGSLEKRVHIIRAIMDRARKRVGPDFPILIKLNSDDNVPGGIRPDIFPELANEIVKTGVDALDVSGNDCIQEDIDTPEKETYFFKGAEALEVSIPIIVTGGNRSIERMEKLLKTGEVNFFGLARPLIREPALPNRWLQGKGDDRAACVSCNGCFNVILQGKTTYCVLEA